MIPFRPADGEAVAFWALITFIVIVVHNTALNALIFLVVLHYCASATTHTRWTGLGWLWVLFWAFRRR